MPFTIFYSPFNGNLSKKARPPPGISLPLNM